MRIVIALGGNALLRRGEPLTAENQRQNTKIACQQIAKVYPGNELVIAHGNGPQVGLIALQSLSYTDVPSYPLDVLGAESIGMIGYMIMQELGNLLPLETPLATLLSQVEVDKNDPAFLNPTKPIGPVYTKEEAEKLAKEKNWSIAPDNDKYRRVVPSPIPKRIFEIRPVKWLLEKGTVVICAGGGGIPTFYDDDGTLKGVEAVIDKDLCSAVLAKQVAADIFIIATDVSAAFVNWGKPNQQAIKEAHPDTLEKMGFAAGSMGPKVQAAINFARENPGKSAVIGSLADIDDIVKGIAGTKINTSFSTELAYY
ncbi:carbamate kinase [Snodgrassella alvi]|jgi:carbamate kinase|uniref:Carbamate kinase n=1 Tax=Snodgrassella alvi TaxID=1196083 RepID=A0A2N9XHL4_9NEIS|nr:MULTISPECIES: carbamate kinase [Snodgrassella]PIT09594.1 carbamate kinase [Snodgrassella communis]PIT22919.1 carbamate kinase [Snodgrassella communis]PIT23401.1 carbamate kinase [Snodgrassella communis]PIT47819.1 carbamate kinase [Snodgrassella alvi]WMY91448.1 carbamate kinase [Snodgrassella communis]